MKNAIILMTALVPTTGHSDLIEFAANLPNTKVHVLINGRSFEPIETETREHALTEHFATMKNVIIRSSIIDSAPQNPEEMETGFWEWWKKEINDNFPETENNWDYVVASETYGQNVAESLNAEFIPYDISRTFNKARGTDVRNNLWENWNDILPEFKKFLHLKATIFGQESVGKTTVSQAVAKALDSLWVMEYARPYLEAVGNEVTLDKMGIIHKGQAALQSKAFNNAVTPVTVLDTDLFSTVGYYSIMLEDSTNECIEDAMKLASDVYYVMPDDIPFVEDPLRYGGDQRESDKFFWLCILKKYNLNHVIVPSGTVEEKTDFIATDIVQRFLNSHKNIIEFERT